MEQEELDKRFVQQEVRLRSLFKSDIQAAIRGEQQNILNHAEDLIQKTTEKARELIETNLQKQLNEFRAQLEKYAKDYAAHRQKTSEEIVGLSANMEERLREHIPVYIKEAVRKVLAEK